MRALSTEDQIYLCKYHDIDENICFSTRLKKDEIEQLIKKFKANGLYEKYRKMSDEEYEDIIEAEKKKDKCTKILDKYMFNKTKKGYTTLKDVMKMCFKYTDSTELSLEKVFRELADKQETKSYIINNDCKRMLDNTYLENQKIFEENGYCKKPTLREFILQELKIGKGKDNICEVKEMSKENKDNVISDITPNIGDIENTFVKVSVKTIMDWSYQKGYLDRMLEEENKN